MKILHNKGLDKKKPTELFEGFVGSQSEVLYFQYTLSKT